MSSNLFKQAADRYSVQLAALDESLAVTFLESMERMEPYLDETSFEEWASSGMQLCRNSWNSIQLAKLFFEKTADSIQLVSPKALHRLFEIPSILARQSISLSASFLEQISGTFSTLPEPCHKEFLHLAVVITVATKADTWLYLEQGPELLAKFNPPQSIAFMVLITTILKSGKYPAFPLLSDGCETLQGIDKNEQTDLIDIAQQLVVIDPQAGVEFLKSIPLLKTQIQHQNMQAWYEAGLEESIRDGQGSSYCGESLQAFFRLESKSAIETLGSLSGNVSFEQFESVLRLYGQALSGENIEVQPSSQLTSKRIGWTSESSSTTDGSAIFVPAVVSTYDNQNSNLQIYKISIAHQSSRLLFGSFDYKYGEDGYYLDSSVSERVSALTGETVDGESAAHDTCMASKPSQLVPMQRFFDLFKDRHLIETLFSLVEDTRIDAKTTEEYCGLRGWMRTTKEQAIKERPELLSMGLRQALVENLMRASLDGIDSIRWPSGITTFLTNCISALRSVTQSKATVQDSSEVAALLYDLAIDIPNIPATRIQQEWVRINESEIPDTLTVPLEACSLSSSYLTEGEECPFDKLPPSDIRGEFKPELVQSLTSIKRKAAIDEVAVAELEEMLKHSVEVEDNTIDAQTLLENLELEITISGEAEGKCDLDSIDEDIGSLEGCDSINWYTYDEWDFRAGDYLSGWCQIGESYLKGGELDYYNEVLSQYHDLVQEVRHQFELMKPESQRKIKNLDDGDEIDLDQAIQFFVDKKAGAGPRARFYSRRDKTERDVAIVFLLDMSGSTKEPVADRRYKHFDQRKKAGINADETANKRIIDLEKEATIVIIEALQAIGDTYAIYGFSGYGKNNASFHIVKEMHESLNDTVRKRLQAIESFRSTRMGVAIRHACSKLTDIEAKTKILILLSDGRPQDHDYGRTQKDQDYAVHDTKQALVEAKRAGIVPFLITVDIEGNDYLQQMCGDIGYEVVTNIESLPKRLPGIYQHLTFIK